MNFNLLKERLDQLVHTYETDGRIGMVVESGKERYVYNEEVVFPSASLIKLPILIEGFNRSSNGRLSLAKLIKLDNIPKVGGSGVIQSLSNQATLTIEDLLTFMIVVSDNTATNFLIDVIGMDAINERCKLLGMKSTVLKRKMMDEEARRKNRENVTSPLDVITCLKAINESRSREMKRILERQQFTEKLPYYLTNVEEMLIANKTGELDKVEHDCAIIEYKGQCVYVAVLIDHLKDNAKGKEAIQLAGAYILESLQS